jgi:hypothetical protein
MKFVCTFLLLLLTFSVQSQSDWVIELSSEKPNSRMGVWTKGDYTISVAIDSISLHLNRCQQSIQRSLDYYRDKDSNLVNYFLGSSNRYKTAVTQLEKANNGFGLNTLIIYEGRENQTQNVGNSTIIESYLKQLVEHRKAIVYFKGMRIYTLCCTSEQLNQGRYETVSDILNSGFVTKTFYDEPSNCLFFESHIYGW